MRDSVRLNEVHRRLDRIQRLSVEIEAVPNMPQDVWTMKEIDRKSREIQIHCRWIRTAVGIGEGESTGTGWG
jgi:hypothetical protein